MASGRTKNDGGALRPEDFRASPTAAGGAGTDEEIDERRREPRVACVRRITILPFHRVGDAWGFGEVVLFDCSRRGLGLYATQPLPAGSLFCAKLRVKGRVTMLVYIVRHCTPWRGGYKVGAEFNGLIGGLVETPLDAGEVLDSLLNGGDSD